MHSCFLYPCRSLILFLSNAFAVCLPSVFQFISAPRAETFMSVCQPCVHLWSPAGLASSINHTEGLGIGMSLMKLFRRESQNSPAVWLCFHSVICLLSGANPVLAFFSCCLSPVSLGYSGVNMKGYDLRVGSKTQWSHLWKTEITD